MLVRGLRRTNMSTQHIATRGVATRRYTAARGVATRYTAEPGLARYFSEISRFPILEARQEKHLIGRWFKKGDKKAYEQLVSSHLRLVAAMARRFGGYGLPMADLIAEGNVGLIKALKGFDPERGVRLSTYAMWWIRASITEYVLRSWSIVKTGSAVAKKRLFFGLKRVKSKLNLTENTDLTAEQADIIGKELDVSPSEAISMNRRMISNDSSLNAVNEHGVEYMDLIADTGPGLEQQFIEKDEHAWRSKMVREAMQQLDERERQVVMQRWLTDTPHTLEDLARDYNVSRERIRQIEKKALEKINRLIRKQVS